MPCPYALKQPEAAPSNLKISYWFTIYHTQNFDGLDEVAALKLLMVIEHFHERRVCVIRYPTLEEFSTKGRTLDEPSHCLFHDILANKFALFGDLRECVHGGDHLVCRFPSLLGNGLCYLVFFAYYWSTRQQQPGIYTCMCAYTHTYSYVCVYAILNFFLGTNWRISRCVPIFS